MDTDFSSVQSQAELDFQRARNRAFWSDLIDRLRGKNVDLLNFDEVKQKLRLRDDRYLGLQDIPLEKIVGSVGRHNDFNRRFLPRKSISKERWKAVDALTMSMTGFPPIEVYKVGDVYFVVDGNHRVSVARANNMETIEAYVTEFKTDVPLDEHTTPEDLFAKAAYADFLAKTNLKKLRPDSEVILTEPVRYPQILNHIEVHHYFLGLDCECEPTWEEGVASWYDNIYMPMVRAIRRHNMLKDFPDRTEADLYVWLIKHQGIMHDLYGGDPMSPEETVDDFLEKLRS
ncbi:MAG: hypothetical protein KJ064_14595 [Anaerolineae bacterium]|nr:hypothetical protein [Anaerolineae bacterium]